MNISSMYLKINNWQKLAILSLLNIILILFYWQPQLLPNFAFLPEFFYTLKFSWSSIKLAYPNFGTILIVVVLLLKIIYFGALILNIFLFYLLMIKNNVKEIFFSLIIIFCTLIIVEIGLRSFNFHPGQYSYSNFFKKVKTLKDSKGYITDERGVFKIDTSYNQEIKYLTENKTSYLKQMYSQDYATSIVKMHQDFSSKELESLKNNFTNKMSVIKNAMERSDYDKALLDYLENPVNKDGFFSPAFKQYKSSKTSILLIGDSFTWGHSTSHKSYSFANELIAKDYIVHNTGIVGTDATQYLEIAKQYIPILKPDIVIVNFYLGNDVSYHYRELTPCLPLYYATNAGNLASFQNGVTFTNSQDAYENILKYTTIPATTLFNKFCSLSCIGSLVWGQLLHFQIVNFGEIDVLSLPEQTTPACNNEIAEIEKICIKNKTLFLLPVIPDYQSNYTKISDFPHLFENLEYQLSPVPKEMYQLSNGHFNDEGHVAYASFLDTLIVQALQEQKNKSEF